MRKQTLREFINNNNNLLTALGVFAALTAFFTTIDSPLSFYMSAVSSLILSLILWETWISFPKSEDASITLKLFEYFLVISSVPYQTSS